MYHGRNHQTAQLYASHACIILKQNPTCKKMVYIDIKREGIKRIKHLK